MTQEEKDLLFKDLCARLPYHVHLKVWLKDGTTEEGFLDLEHNYGDVLRDAFYYNEIIDIKPYLRPMSSMTEEEKKELREMCDFGHSYNDYDDYGHYGIELVAEHWSDKLFVDSRIQVGAIDELHWVLFGNAVL